MQGKNVIVILCLFFASSYAQKQAPVPEWIPGLPEDIAHTILLSIVKVANSDKECFQTLQNLSYVNKQWHALVQPEENKVCQTLNAKHVQVHKRLGVALSEKFLLNPALAVALGTQVVEEQANKFEKMFEADVEKNDYKIRFIPIEYASSRWDHQCLGHAIRKNKKYIVKLLCPMKYMNIINLKMNSEWGEIPLLAGAILYNRNENELTIIDCLLKAGANINKTFSFPIKVEGDKSEDCPRHFVVLTEKGTGYSVLPPFSSAKKLRPTPLGLAQKLNKQKIVAKLQEYR